MPPDSDSTVPPYTIRRCTAAELIGLRLRILRPEGPRHEVEFAEDELPGAVHYCAEHGGIIIGCVSFLPSRLDARSALRMRAMATEPAWMSRGVGTALLATAERELGSREGRLVWCNARESARGFYERNGWRAASEVFANGNAGPSLKMVKVVIAG